MITSIPVEQKQTFFMDQALQESLKARYIAPPNPWVGCVIVKHGTIIARGHTQPHGKEHAEVMALKAAQEEAEGSTVYVTLEPCAHFGNTPPCCEALIKAGVSKVVIGILDPDQNVRGKGVAKLQNAGIEVEVGTLSEEVRASILPYCHQRETGYPFCILKAAVSMDGKIAARDGSSFWITGKKAREDVHLLRAQSQAILVGTQTVIEDTPKLTVRDVELKEFQQPLRILLDAKGRILPKGALFDTQLAPTMVVTTEQASKERQKQWEEKGCEVVTMPLDARNRGIDLKALLKFLGQRGILQIMVEGGSKVFSSLIEDKLINKIVLYMGSCLLGAEGVSLFSKLKLGNMDEAIRLHLKEFTSLGKDLRLDYTC